METTITIPGPNGDVSGIVRGVPKDEVVIFVHGLAGSPNDHIFYNGARFLERHGLASFRYAVYSSVPLVKATLKTHAADLDAVVSHFRSAGVKRVSVVGHSYGGSTILFSIEKQFDRVVLWDPAHGDALNYDNLELLPDGKRYVVGANPDFIIGRAMVDESRLIDWNALGRDMDMPTAIIAAGNGILQQACKIFYDNLHGERRLQVIEEADHRFNAAETATELLKGTLEWLTSSQDDTV